MTVHRSSDIHPRLITSGPDAIKYNDTVWNDQQAPASATQINPGTSKPDIGAFPTGATYTKTFLFDSASRETVTFLMQLSHEHNPGSTLKPHVHYSPTVTDATSKTITWDFNYRLAAKDEVFPGSDTTLTATYTGATVANTHMVISLGDITGVTGLSTMLVCALSRRGDTDTYGDDVALLEFDIHYEILVPGSDHEYIR